MEKVLRGVGGRGKKNLGEDEAEVGFKNLFYSIINESGGEASAGVL